MRASALVFVSLHEMGWQMEIMPPMVSDENLPVDNVIIESVRRYCEEQWGKLNLSRPLRRRLTPANLLRSYVSPHRSAPIDIGQQMIEAPISRPDHYRLFLTDSAIIVFLGGGGGVSRLIAECRALDHPFVALTAFGGLTQEMIGPIYRNLEPGEFVSGLDREACLRLQDRNLEGLELCDITENAACTVADIWIDFYLRPPPSSAGAVFYRAARRIRASDSHIVCVSTVSSLTRIALLHTSSITLGACPLVLFPFHRVTAEAEASGP